MVRTNPVKVETTSQTTSTKLVSPSFSIQKAKVKSLGSAKLEQRVIAGVSIRSANVLEFHGLKGEYVKNCPSLDVQFGQLTKTEFDALHAEFGGDSKVAYSPLKEYSVVDFLPPFLQAMLHCDLDSTGELTLKGSKPVAKKLFNRDESDLKLRFHVNCHGTAWEAARAFTGQLGRTAQLGFGDGTLAQMAYDRYFSPVEFRGKTSNLKPGDVVTFTDESGSLLHSSVYVGGGLFFEKPNTENDLDDETPYRLATFEQVRRPLLEMGYDTRDIRAFRANEKLPTLDKVFAPQEALGPLKAWLAEKKQTLDAPVVVSYDVGGMQGISILNTAFVVCKEVALSVPASNQATARAL